MTSVGGANVEEKEGSTMVVYAVLFLGCNVFNFRVIFVPCEILIREVEVIHGKRYKMKSFTLKESEELRVHVGAPGCIYK